MLNDLLGTPPWVRAPRFGYVVNKKTEGFSTFRLFGDPPGARVLAHPTGYIYNPPKPSFEKEGFPVLEPQADV